MTWLKGYLPAGPVAAYFQAGCRIFAMNGFIKVGKIARPVGLNGEILAKAFSSLDSITASGSLFLATRSGRYEEFFINAFREKKAKQAVLSLRHVDSRDKAEILSGMTIFQDITRLPAGNDEYYWFQLKGLDVVTVNGRWLGKVSSVMETGAADVLIVRNRDIEILVPMVDEVIKRVDIDRGKCVVDLPPGLEEATGTRIGPKKVRCAR